MLALAFTFTRTPSTVLPVRLLLGGGTKGRRLLLALLLTSLLSKVRIATLALDGGNLLCSLCTLVLSAVSLGLKLTYDLTGNIIQL